MRRLISAVLLLACVHPSSAATLKGFEGQFRGAAAATRTAQAADTVIRHDDSDGSLVKLTLLLLAAPYAMSYDIQPEGYSPGLYAGDGGDMGDATSQHRLALGYHRVASYVDGWSGRWRLDTERHIGLEAFWTDYIEHREEDLHYVGAAAHGDFWRAEAGRANYQLGLAALSGRLTRVGPRLGLEAELYPRKPFFVDALAAVTFIDGGPLGELRAGGGAAWKRAQLRLSWRALIGPMKNLAGPEFALIVRL
jgi:hypothetical protein